MATVGRAATVEGLDGEASGRRPQPARRRLRAGLLVAAGLARGGGSELGTGRRRRVGAGAGRDGGGSGA